MFGEKTKVLRCNCIEIKRTKKNLINYTTINHVPLNLAAGNAAPSLEQIVCTKHQIHFDITFSIDNDGKRNNDNSVVKGKGEYECRSDGAVVSTRESGANWLRAGGALPPRARPPARRASPPRYTGSEIISYKIIQQICLPF